MTLEEMRLESHSNGSNDAVCQMSISLSTFLPTKHSFIPILALQSQTSP